MPRKLTKASKSKIKSKRAASKATSRKVSKSKRTKVVKSRKQKKMSTAPSSKRSPSVKTHWFQNDDWYIPKVGKDEAGELRTDWLGTRTGFGK